MKLISKSFILASISFLIAGHCSAGLNPTLTFEHATIIKNEPVNIFIELENTGNQRLRIGSGESNANSKVRFVIEHDELLLSQNSNTTPMIEEMLLLPGKKITLMIDISKWFRFPDCGKYMIYALFSANGKRYKSNKIVLDVVSGIELTSLTIPKIGDDSTTLKCSLRYWQRNKSEYIFFCVSDAKTEANYGVFQLGRLLRVYQPQMSIDRFGIVKIIYQTAATCFVHVQFDLSMGKVIFVDQTYNLRDGSPFSSSVTNKPPSKPEPTNNPVKKRRSFFH